MTAAAVAEANDCVVITDDGYTPTAYGYRRRGHGANLNTSREPLDP